MVQYDFQLMSEVHRRRRRRRTKKKKTDFLSRILKKIKSAGP